MGRNGAACAEAERESAHTICAASAGYTSGTSTATWADTDSGGTARTAADHRRSSYSMMARSLLLLLLACQPEPSPIDPKGGADDTLRLQNDSLRDVIDSLQGVLRGE